MERRKPKSSRQHFSILDEAVRDGSQFGIEGGRISKLMLKRNDTIVCNYDRGWDIEPADPDTRLALEILLHGENQ